MNGDYIFTDYQRRHNGVRSVQAGSSKTRQLMSATNAAYKGYSSVKHWQHIDRLERWAIVALPVFVLISPHQPQAITRLKRGLALP